MRIKGCHGESMAKDFLMDKGYKIMTKNFWTRRGEIDIVAKKNQSIHIIEVKYQVTALIESGYKLNRKKRKRIIYSSKIFMANHGLTDFYYQFDLISIVGTQITHFQNVFNLNDV